MTNTPVEPTVEMLIDGVWVDITADCRLDSADSGGGISITRGRPNEGNTAEPTQLGFTLNNVDGKYSDENPNGPYYGKLGRNQPVRVGISRRYDKFERATPGDTWVTLPDRIDPEGKLVAGEKWNLTGALSSFQLTGVEATIQSTTGTQSATFGTYGDVEVSTKVRVTNRNSEFGIMLRMKSAHPAQTDGTFENGVGGWQIVGGSLNVTTAQKRYGNQSAVVVVSGSPQQTYMRPIQQVPVVPGGSYRVRGFVRFPVARDVFLAWDWFDVNGGYLTTTGSGPLGITANTWFWVQYTGTAPPGAAYAVYGPTIGDFPPNGFTAFFDNFEYLDLTDLSWYKAYLVPQVAPADDRLRIAKLAPGVNETFSVAFTPAVVAGQWYRMKAQITGQRLRVKAWKDGDPEPDWQFINYDNRTDDLAAGPTFGEVGVFASDGDALVFFDEVQVDTWRAHAEIAELPVRWDLSRRDRWVPIQARGPLRRLGQGRKALQSAVTLHLTRYASLSAMWFPLEGDTGESASNAIVGGLSGLITNLTFQVPERTGALALPGVAGYAHFAEDNSRLVASANTYASTGKWTLLFFFRIPSAAPSDTVMATIQTTGTARTWQIVIGTGNSMHIRAIAPDGTIVSQQSNLFYFDPALPPGSWLAAALYIFQNGANVEWAFNFRRPGSDTGVFSINNIFVGQIGIFRTVTFTGSASLTAAGGLHLTQVFHYAGDLPFVDYNFAQAAAAYVGETAMARFLRLTSDAGIRATRMGAVGGTEPMGAQLPAKLLDLLEECAQVDDGILMEERGDLAIALMSRLAHYNTEKLTLDIDAGHLSDPLEPVKDDQGTRNDVTVSRPGGGFAISVQKSGPLNVNAPEDDVDGVGVYDEAPEINFATDSQLQSAADWRRSRGTLNEVRYPSVRTNLAASAYQASPALTARLLSLDSGRLVAIRNPEVSPNTADQIVQSYNEKIDQYDYDLTLVTAPGRLYTAGVVCSSSTVYRNPLRVQPAGQVVNTSFVVGVGTVLSSKRIDATFDLWATTAVDPRVTGFDIMVGGVRLRVISISGGASPQSIQVDPVPVNGVYRTIPVNTPIKLADPPRIAW